MRIKIIYITIVLFFLQATSIINAQSQLPFWEHIQKVKQQDSVAFPAPNQILFIGSSSFTMWEDVQTYFPDKKILNRAFGGSTLEDLIRYRYEVIYPYAPKQIVMYCGENDFAFSDTVAVSTVVNRFKALFRLIRLKYPDVPFVYVSMKPSPSRGHLMKKFAEANHQIANFLNTQKRSVFIDVYHKMLNKDGSFNEDIYLEDKLHMNAKGYAIWKKLLSPVLIK